MSAWSTREMGRKLDAELEFTSPRYIELYYLSVLHKQVTGSKETRNLKRPEWVGRYAKHHFVSMLDDKEWSNERMKEKARKAVDRLEKDARAYEKEGDETAAEYMNHFHETATGLGNEIHMEFKKVLKKIRSIHEEKETLGGKLKIGLDLLGFRLGTGVGLYEVMDGPFSEAEVDLYGVKITGRDLKYFGLALGVVIGTFASYKWEKSKEEAAWKMLRQNIRQCAKDASEEILRSYEDKYPDAVRKFRPKADDYIRKKIKRMNGDNDEDSYSGT